MELLLKINGFICQFVTNPKVWQRVLVFGVLTFFVAYELNAGKPMTTALELAKTYYFLVLIVLWVLFAGTQDPKDYLRICLSGFYGSLFYMILWMGAIGGHWLVQAFFVFFLGSFFFVYALTGMTIDSIMQELKARKDASIPPTIPQIITKEEE